MPIIVKYKFDKSIYADLLPEFNAEFTSDSYNTTDEEVDGIITRTIESDNLPTLMRFGRAWVEGESATDNRTDSLLEVLEMNTSGLTSCSNMFRYCKNLTSIICEWDTSKVISMQYMFVDCNNLTSLDVSNFDTSNVTDMFGMFFNCYNLISLDLSNFNTSKVTNMSHMFFNCAKLTSLDVSNFNTSKVTDMCYMFYYCYDLTSLDLSNFDTSKVTNMENMFSYCYNLVSLDVNNFDTSKVTNMAHMFDNCNKLTTLDVGNFNTNDVTTMYAMFNATDKLISLDISNFSISDTTKIDYILTNTLLLTDIGMLYCNQSTIETIASLLPTDITQTIWVEDVDIKDLTPVEGVEFKQYAKDTEIMLTSPLLEGDKLIVKDGKVYHYHKMSKVVLDGSEDWVYNVSNDTIIRFCYNPPMTCKQYVYGITSDKFPSNGDKQNIETIFQYENEGIIIGISKSKLSTANVTGFKQWLQANPTTVVYELATPYYELISEDPLDISLISETVDITNSSNIPLNMTINNKGLSTIAMKPSTTYTVAFDKEGEEDLTVNLCGNEITTSNNVVEITTSSELGNNELIFYGDGVEVSNVRLLEGSVSGDSIPRESFEGLKNSFEDGYIENMVNDNRYRCVLKLSEPNGTTPFEEMYPLAEGNRVRSDLLEVKSNTTYTVHAPGYIVTVHEYNSNKIWIKDHLWQSTEAYTFTTMSDCTGLVIYIKKSDNKVFTEDEANSVSMILLEEKEFNNLGKYKVEYKVTGKNKLYKVVQGSFYQSDIYYDDNGVQFHCGEGLVRKGVTYTTNFGLEEIGYAVLLDNNRRFVEHYFIIGDNPTITPSQDGYLLLRSQSGIGDTKFDATVLQLEEGSTATEYEPYKSYTKTFYLNSPLLEGDTIEDVNGVATHVKRYNKVVLDGSEDWKVTIRENNEAYFFTPEKIGKTLDGVSLANPVYSDSLITRSDNPTNTNLFYNSVYTAYDGNICMIYNNLGVSGIKQWLQANPTTVVYELASPIYEPISTESILCDSYVNGHLDVDTNIPIEKVGFNNKLIQLKYVIPNTAYIVQFESDNIGKLDVISMGNYWVDSNKDVVKGINKYEVISNPNTTAKVLSLVGIGFNASNIQVVATDRDVDFGYFKGLQSSFESELVTDEADENYGKYKVECKVVGKNKFDGVLPEKIDCWSSSCYIKKGTYRFSANLSGFNNGTRLVIAFADKDGEIITNTKIGYNTILDRDCYEMYFYSNDYNYSQSLNNFVNISNFQLEEGTQATSYEPYQEYTRTIYLNSPLLKGDTIEVHNGKLCHYHKMGRVVLDGSNDEAFVLASSDDAFSVFYIHKDVKKVSHVYCDNIPSADAHVSLSMGKFLIGSHASDDTLRICIENTKLSSIDVNGFKQWLQQNPTTVVYELTEPWYEEITPTQEDLIITSVKEGDLHIDTIVPISSKVTYNVNVQLLTDFEQSIVEQVQATQTTDLQSILDEEIDN